MEIKIQCDTKLYLPLENIQDFQGALKSLDPIKKEKLKKQILDHGFSAPIFVWKNNGKYFCLDGTQRRVVLTELKSAGYKIPDLPCVEIFAKTKLEAKNKLLSYVSAFGKVDKQGLYDFIIEAEMDITSLDDLEIPEIDIEMFKSDFFESGDLVQNPENEWKEMPDYNDPEPCFRKVIVNFDSASDVEDFFKLIGQSYTEKTKSIWHPYKERRDLESLRYEENEK